MARTKGAIAERWWSDAVRLAVSREADDDGKKRRRLSIIADKLCTLAMSGDMQAIKEIGDRLEGRPKQQIEATGEGGGPLTINVVTGVPRD